MKKVKNNWIVEKQPTAEPGRFPRRTSIFELLSCADFY